MLLTLAGFVVAERHHTVHAAANHAEASGSPSSSPSPSPSDPPSPSPSPTVDPCAPGTDTVVSASDHGAPDGRRAVWVHRPAGPDSATIPVLYLLHGFPGDPSGLTDSSLPQTLDSLMCQTGQPFVVAVPDGRSGETDTEWGDDQSGRFDIETFVTSVAIGLVEGDQRRPASLRAIGGFSMGGYGAATLALRHPDEYRQIAAFGGYYHPDDPDQVFADDSDHAPDQMVDSAHGQRYFLVEGTSDETPLMDGTIHGEADRFARLLRDAGVTVKVSHPDGGHSPDAWYQELPAMVSFLDTGWSAN